MFSRILRRVAFVWIVLVFGWAAILNANVPGVMAHGGWGAVALGAFLPAGLVFALAWVFQPRR